MNTFTYNITNNDIADIINTHERENINSSKSILIQLFSGEAESKTKNVLHYLRVNFPAAKIISTSTDGEINQDEVSTFNTIISISTFSSTQIKSAYSKEETSFQTGVTLAKKLIQKDTKLLIAFVDGLSCNGEEFLDGIYSISSHIIVAGGLSGDNAKFIQCFIGIEDELFDKGAVGVSLNSTLLHVENYYNFGWRSIGLKHKITKAKDNRLYMIDDMTAVEFYTKYLGNEVANALPATGIEFPLIIDIDNFKKARAITAKHTDGSLSFAGNIPENESVHIGIARVESILSTNVHNLKNMNVESFFIYSCMARRRFLPKLIYKEIAPFANIAPTSGFFTYGEFFTDTKPELLNQTLTAVALSELETCNLKKNDTNINAQTEYDNTYEVLANIIDIKSKELEEQTLLQEKISKELDAKNNTLEVIHEMSNLGSWELDLEYMNITWSKMNYKIYNMNPKKGPPTYLEFLNMILPEDRKKLIEVQKNLTNENIHSLEIRVKRNDGKIITIIESGKLLFENNKPVKIIGTTLDITNIKIQDNMLMQQSKYAQMGEMINMIAHQWRQPLNAISASTIKLNMLSEMGKLTADDIKIIAKFIEDMTQKMSQTINDFMDFNKPSVGKESVNFHNILEDIFKIIGTQLKNHNITIDISIEPNINIYTYKKELEHILINIITNARDALEELDDRDKNININIYAKNKLCFIKISDNAGGISEENVDRVFDPYFTTKSSNKGTGLGLYMSKKILREHLNGDIFVRNKNGGAEFTIMLEDCYE